MADRKRDLTEHKIRLIYVSGKARLLSLFFVQYIISDFKRKSNNFYNPAHTSTNGMLQSSIVSINCFIQCRMHRKVSEIKVYKKNFNY